MNDLLTGRELVGMLSRLGIGTWTPDAVRQWIREEPKCPIAEHADQGKPHRYRIAAVLIWLKQRTLAERAKGFTRGGPGEDLVDRIDIAIKHVAAGTVPVEAKAEVARPEKIGALTAPSAGEGSAAADLFSAPASGLQGDSPRPIFRTDPTKLSDVNWLLEIVAGRDASNYNKIEQGLKLRRERMMLERKIIPIEELETSLSVNAEHVISNIRTAIAKLKAGFGELLDTAARIEADRIVDETFEWLFQRLANTDDVEAIPAPADRSEPDSVAGDVA